MRICIVGLGSIGIRHIKNLLCIGQMRNIRMDIDALRSGKKNIDISIKKAIQKEYYDIDNLPEDYDIIFITNPTNMHFEMLSKIINKTKHVFIEKPVFDHCDYDIHDLNLIPGNIYYVACPLRYTPVIRHLKKIISSEVIYSVRAISSSYLPSWRKNVDYRTIYSAKKSMGGGVSLDLIHEWDYLIYLFGFPEKVLNLKGKYSGLEIDSDDISIYLAQYKDKLVEVHLDYFGRNTVRRLELLCKEYVIYADFIEQKIEFIGEKNDILKFELEDCYINEMNYFFDIIMNHAENSNDINIAYQTLRTVLKNEMQGV